jgi:Zn-finger nucleic acid-binding protein
MNCPSCKEEKLVMTERQNIEIDYCPSCRGIWLDRGELDKLIERSIALEKPQSQQASQTHYDSSKEYKKHDDYRRHDDHKYHKKKGSWLSDLFD